DRKNGDLVERELIHRGGTRHDRESETRANGLLHGFCPSDAHGLRQPNSVPGQRTLAHFARPRARLAHEELLVAERMCVDWLSLEERMIGRGDHDELVFAPRHYFDTRVRDRPLDERNIDTKLEER